MTIGNRVAILREKFTQSIGLPFADILPESQIKGALKEEGVSYRKRLFCPIVTLWAWTSQVLDLDISCKKASYHLILGSSGTNTTFDRHRRLLQSTHTTQREFSVPTVSFDRETASSTDAIGVVLVWSPRCRL